MRRNLEENIFSKNFYLNTSLSVKSSSFIPDFLKKVYYNEMRTSGETVHSHLVSVAHYAINSIHSPEKRENLILYFGSLLHDLIEDKGVNLFSLNESLDNMYGFLVDVLDNTHGLDIAHDVVCVVDAMTKDKSKNINDELIEEYNISDIKLNLGNKEIVIPKDYQLKQRRICGDIPLRFTGKKLDERLITLASTVAISDIRSNFDEYEYTHEGLMQQRLLNAIDTNKFPNLDGALNSMKKYFPSKYSSIVRDNLKSLRRNQREITKEEKIINLRPKLDFVSSIKQRDDKIKFASRPVLLSPFYERAIKENIGENPGLEVDNLNLEIKQLYSRSLVFLYHNFSKKIFDEISRYAEKNNFETLYNISRDKDIIKNL